MLIFFPQADRSQDLPREILRYHYLLSIQRRQLLRAIYALDFQQDRAANGKLVQPPGAVYYLKHHDVIVP